MNSADVFIDTVLKQVVWKMYHKRIAKELYNHIDDKKEYFMLMGLEENKAEQEAVFCMGDAKELGKQLNKYHKPYLLFIKICIMCANIFLLIAIIICLVMQFYR